MHTLSRPLCHSIISAEKGRAPPLSPASARSKEGGFCLLTLPHAWMTHDALTLFLLCSGSSLALGATATHTSCLKKKGGENPHFFFWLQLFFPPGAFLDTFPRQRHWIAALPRWNGSCYNQFYSFPSGLLTGKTKPC